jgi:hypothetical protein
MTIHPVKSAAPASAGTCHPLSEPPEYWLSQFSTVINSVIAVPVMIAVILGSRRRGLRDMPMPAGSMMRLSNWRRRRHVPLGRLPYIGSIRSNRYNHRPAPPDE